MNLTLDQIENLKARLAAGERITRLGHEVGIPWQRLWGILKGAGAQQQSGQQQSQPRPKREAQPKHRGHETRRTSTSAVVRDSDGIDRITFDSVGEAVVDALADYAQNDHNRTFIAGRLAGHMNGHDDWANYYTRSKLLDTIANPPRKLLAAVEEMRQSLMDEVCPPVCSRRRVVRNQDFGDELTPEAVLVRSLTPWERMSRETQPRRSVTIGVNLTVHSGQRAEHLLWRGAAAAALADILTQRGVNVEIVAFWTIGRISNRSDMVVSRYVVKRADMPLDLGAVSVALAEIAYARLICLYGLGRHLPGILSKHLGHCESLPEADKAGIDYLAERNVTSREAAETWLRESAARQESGVLHV
jgi:hypothetical protein